MQVMQALNEMSIKHFEGLRFPKDAVAREVDALLSSLRSGAQPPAVSRLQAVQNQHNEAVAVSALIPTPLKTLHMACHACRFRTATACSSGEPSYNSQEPPQRAVPG